LTVAGSFGSGPAQLVTARVAAQTEDALVVLDGAGEQLQIVAAQGDKLHPNLAATASWAVSGVPVAVLPLRLNSDAVSDLVVTVRTRRQRDYNFPARPKAAV
jgi:hypothetical protein